MTQTDINDGSIVSTLTVEGESLASQVTGLHKVSVALEPFSAILLGETPEGVLVLLLSDLPGALFVMTCKGVFRLKPLFFASAR